MTIPFCERHKRLVKPICLTSLFFDIIVIEEEGTLQSTWRWV